MNIEHIPTRAEIRARRERLGRYGKPEAMPGKLSPIIIDDERLAERDRPSNPLWFRILDDKPLPTMDKIIRAVAKHYGRTPNDLRSKSREFKCVRPRMVAVYIARSITELSFPQIGRFLGGRDHTTSLHSFQKIEKLIAAGDLELKATVDEIVSQFAVPE